MSAVFLSASVPLPGRAGFRTGDAYLIREAVSAFVEVVLGRRPIVWGGHPAVTPMIWAAAEYFGISYRTSVALFQSQFFADRYPEDNDRFGNVTFVPAAEAGLEASLLAMRMAMLKSQPFESAVFIGGMEGILAEYEMFKGEYPKARVVALPSPGGVARDIYYKEQLPADLEHALDYSAWLYELLQISPNEERSRS